MNFNSFHILNWRFIWRIKLLSGYDKKSFLEKFCGKLNIRNFQIPWAFDFSWMCCPTSKKQDCFFSSQDSMALLLLQHNGLSWKISKYWLTGWKPDDALWSMTAHPLDVSACIPSRPNGFSLDQLWSDLQWLNAGEWILFLMPGH